MSILVNFLAVENEIKFLTVPEICQLVSCLHIFKISINKYDSRDTLVSEFETLFQLLDELGSSISFYFEIQERTFSIHQMKNLLAYYIGSTMSEEVKKKALLLINSSVKNTLAVDDSTSQKRLYRGPDSDNASLKEDCFGCLDDQTNLFTTNQLTFEKAWIQEILKLNIVEDFR